MYPVFASGEEGGFALLERLSRDGWSVSIVAALVADQPGVRIRATHPDGRVVVREGSSVADASLLVWEVTRAR